MTSAVGIQVGTMEGGTTVPSEEATAWWAERLRNRLGSVPPASTLPARGNVPSPRGESPDQGSKRRAS